MRDVPRETVAREGIRTIVIDPPWMEKGGGKTKRGADKHYPLLSTPEIIRTVLQGPFAEYEIAKDAHMYLWATNNFLPDGLKVMDSLGFRYITNIVWMKNRMGLGQYFRGKHELCLFGVTGRGFGSRTDDRGVPSAILADTTGHSRKPGLFYDTVERRSFGPYLDVFSRLQRNGWSTWGNEAGGIPC